MKTFLAEKMMPTFPVVRNVDINFPAIKNQGSAGCVCTKRTAISQHSYIFWILCSLGFLGCPGHLDATMGIAVVTTDSVVIGMDSQISGPNSRLSCKLVHQGKIVIIASGSYNFSVDSGRYELWDQAKEILAQSTSVEEAAIALDDRIEPLLKSGLNTLYLLQPSYYLRRYGGRRPVVEFIVAGVDRYGPSAHKYRYFAKTPADFRADNHRFASPVAGQIKIVTVPSVDPFAITPPPFWNITTEPGQPASSAIANKIVDFIHAVQAKFPDSGISDPISTVVIGKDGFRFLNPGECNDK